MELVGNAFFFDREVSLIIWLQAHMGSFGTPPASLFLEVHNTTHFVRMHKFALAKSKIWTLT